MTARCALRRLSLIQVPMPQNNGALCLPRLIRITTARFALRRLLLIQVPMPQNSKHLTGFPKK